MKYICTLIAVKDMGQAKQFYKDILGLEVVADFGANVTLSGGIALQTADTWKGFIHRGDADIVFSNNACELYFEEDNIDGFIAKLRSVDNVRYVHPLIEHSWGQRVVRFYDPDGHIIEVGENLSIVIKRFLESGLSVKDTASRMDVPIEFIKLCLAE